MERRRLLPEQFFKYVTQLVSREDMNLWVKVNNIHIEKINLFGDYLKSLYIVVVETYLGKDVIKNDDEIKGHFNWCWDKIIDNFNKENIFFKKEGPHYEYFFNFFYESFYANKHEEQREKIKEFLNHLFIVHNEKTKSELDMLYEMYVLLNESLTVK
jgi:hypothetical protein